MKIKYDTLRADIADKSDDITIISWSCNIGYGQLVIDTKTEVIIDDENMGIEFCEKVIKIAKDNVR